MSKKIRIQAELDDSKLRKQLDDIGKRKEKVTVDIDSGNIGNADQSMKHLNRTVADSNSVFGRLKSTISNTFSSGKIMLTGYLMVLNEINKAGKNAKQTIQEIDKAITDLSVVTNMSRESVSGLIKDYNTYAKQLSSTTTQITSAADDYLRAGKSMSETQALIKDSIMLSKLGQLESGAATEDLLAVMNGYEMSIEEVGKALDAMVAIDMKAATSAGDIATALKYCASSADVAGLSFDKLAAMIATTQEKTMQSAETIGTFMNTILSRYRNVKIGQFVDDDGEDLSEIETILDSLDIKLRDSSQEFRDFEKVIEEVAQSWDSYSSVQQAAIAKAFSGTRQQNRFLALMEGYNKTLELTEVAANSAGTAVEKFNNSYMESLEAKQNALQASFEFMIMNTDFSEVYSGILDATTALVEFIDKTNALKGALAGLTVAGGIKAFLTIKTGVTEAYIALNKFQSALDITKKVSISTTEYEKLLLLSNGLSVSQMKLVLSTNSLTLAQKQELLMASGLSAEEAALQLETWGMTAANTGLTASTVTLGNALKALWATMITNPIIMLTTMVSAAVMAYQAYKQHVVEANEATQEAINTFESISSEVDDLEGKLSELNEQISKLDPITDAEDIENLQLETEELEKQLAILKEKQRIAESDADKAAQKSLGMTEASRYKTEDRESAYGGIETGAAYVTKDEELQNAIEAYEEYKKKVDEANDSLANMAKTGEYTQSEWDKQEEVVSAYSDKMEDARTHANELATSLDEQKQGLNGNTDASQALLTKIDGVITQYDQWLDRINGTTEALEEQSETEEEASNNITQPVSLSISQTIDQLNTQLKPAFDSLKSAYQDIFTDDGFTLENIDTSMLSSIKSAIDELNKMEDVDINVDYSSFENLAKVLTDSSSTAEDVQNSFNNFASTILDAVNPAISQCDGESYKLLQTLLESMGIVNAEEVLMAQLGYSYEEYANAKESAANAGIDLNNSIDSVATALQNEGLMATEDAQQIMNYMLAKMSASGATIDVSSTIGQLAEEFSWLADLIDQWGLYYSVSKKGSGSGNVKGSKNLGVGNYTPTQTTKVKQKVEIEPVFDGNKANRAAKSAGSKAGKSYKDGLKEELSNLDSVISGITGKIDDQISAINEQKSAALDAISEEKEALEEAKDQALESIEQEREARLDAIEEQRKQIEQNISEKQKIIDSINDEIKAMRSANSYRKLQNTLMKEQYELERLQHQHTILQYNEDKGMHYVANTKNMRSQKQAVEDAKLEIEIANKEKQIDLIEKEISLLENKLDILDEEEDRINDYFDNLSKQTEAYYDQQIKALEKQRKETEAFYSSITKNLENQKSKFQELTELLEKAELSAKLKQLGIDEEALLNGSEEEFEKLKNAYMNVVTQLMDGNDKVLDNLGQLSNYNGTAPAMLDDSNTKLGTMNDELGNANKEVGNVNSSLGETATTTGNVATNVSDVNTNIGETTGLVNEQKGAFDELKQTIDLIVEAINKKIQAIETGQSTVATATSAEIANFQLLINKILEVKEKLDEVNTTVSTIDRQPIDNLANAFQLLYDKILLVSNLLGVSMEGEGEGAVSGFSGAIQALNEISLEEGIIAQFTMLKEAIDSVTAAISGGGGESSEGEGSGSGSGSKGGKSGGKGSEGKGKGESGGGNSLTGAIEELGSTAQEVIGEPDAEGDGTVIGEFGSMETAVNDVRDAIGMEGSEGGEGGSSGSGGENDDTLVGSIEYLGDKTEEEMGESGGDGIIGRFEEFRDVIGQADEHVKSISEGLDEIDGKEVECTITVNIKTNGSMPSALGSGMNLGSATYEAKYLGNAHVEGTALASGNWAVQSDEKKALVGEEGFEIIVRNGNFFTVGNSGAEMTDIKKGDIVFNHEQSVNLLKYGHISGRGKAYADGTVGGGKILASDGSILRELQPGDRMYDMMQKFDAYFNSMDGNLEKLVPNSVYEHQRQMENMVKQITNNSIVNNTRNVQQPVINGGIHITCPGVTSKEVAQQVGVELNNMFSGLHLEAMQQSMKR